MDASFHTKPFSFDRIFAIPKAGWEESGNAAHDLIALTAEYDLLKLQMESGITVARAEGFEAGLEQARSEIEAALLAATDALHSSIETVEGEFELIEQRMSSAAADVAMAAADGLAARALAIDPAMAVDEAIGRVLTQVARGQELSIHVNPALVERMEALIADRQSRDRRRLSLTVIADSSLVIGDALISWEQGGLALDAAARRTAILSELGLNDHDADRQ
ncbi:MAG: FliH/SctL family protein [Pseudomonadota bacterium]